MKVQTLFAIIFTCAFIDRSDSARILGLFPIQLPSHFIMYETIMKTLAKRGHYVDVLNHFPQKKPLPRYRDFNISGTVPMFHSNVTYEFIQENINGIRGSIEGIFKIVGYEICVPIFNTTQFLDLFHSNVHYDLIITEALGNDCLLLLTHRFRDVPVVAVSTSIVVPWITDRFGIPDNPAYIPNYFMSYTPEMTFFERIFNAAIVLILKIINHYIIIPNTDQKIQEIFGAGYPSIEELSRNISLLLVNSHHSINYPRPLPPNVIEIAGLHLDNDPGELPQDIEKILNTSKNGIIFFSLGSLIVAESFPPHIVRSLIDAFSQLPYTILWKTGKYKLPDSVPKNIVFSSWFPQRQILCHPKTKLFITHGGMFSTQEAIYCGVPMVGIPIFADQQHNVQNCVQKHIALELPVNNITKDNVLVTVNTVLRDDRFRENVQQISTNFKDRPMSAIDTAMYWIEYTIRHKGTPHLRPASAQLPWYKLYMLDVIGCIIICITLILIILYKVVTVSYKALNMRASIKQKLH